MSEFHLSFSHIVFGYPSAVGVLFQDLCCTFPAGWTGIVGFNGSGKTTLLNSSGGRTLASSAQLPLEPYAQKIRDGAWKIAIPLKQFRTNESGSDFTSVMLQFRGSRDGIASFTLRGMAVQPNESRI